MRLGDPHSFSWSFSHNATFCHVISFMAAGRVGRQKGRGCLQKAFREEEEEDEGEEAKGGGGGKRIVGHSQLCASTTESMSSSVTSSPFPFRRRAA